MNKFTSVSKLILDNVTHCGVISFNQLTTYDHRGFIIDVHQTCIRTCWNKTYNSPFDRSLQSANPKSARKDKDKLKKSMYKHCIYQKVNQLLNIVKIRKQTNKE